MRAMLLLGGFGTRLRPLTNDTPKQMLPVCGRPMIEWVCEHLGSHGVSDVVLSLGYRADAFTETYPHGRIGSLAYEVAVEPEPRGTAGAVRFAAEAVGVDEPFLVLNGDVLTDLDIGALVRFHAAAGGAASIALQPVPDPTPYGLVTISETGRVIEFAEKPTPGARSVLARRAEWPTISAGTYVIDPSVLERIPSERAVSIEREVFPALVADAELYARSEDTYWLDTGTPQQYLAANLDVLEGRRAHARVADGNDVNSAGIHPGALIRTSVIGSGCVIGPDAVVQRSVLGEGCLLGAGAVVIDSILGAGVVVGPLASLTEFSVLGSGERVRRGAVFRARRQPADCQPAE